MVDWTRNAPLTRGRLRGYTGHMTTATNPRSLPTLVEVPTLSTPLVVRSLTHARTLFLQASGERAMELRTLVRALEAEKATRRY